MWFCSFYPTLITKYFFPACTFLFLLTELTFFLLQGELLVCTPSHIHVPNMQPKHFQTAFVLKSNHGEWAYTWLNRLSIKQTWPTKDIWRTFGINVWMDKRKKFVNSIQKKNVKDVCVCLSSQSPSLMFIIARLCIYAFEDGDGLETIRNNPQFWPAKSSTVKAPIHRRPQPIRIWTRIWTSSTTPLKRF